jgi:hypothetical protein
MGTAPEITRRCDELLSAGMRSDEIAARLAANPAADTARRPRDTEDHATFRGFIDPRIRLSRRQWRRLRRLGFLPVFAGGEAVAGSPPAGVVAMLPFTSSAHEHTEQAFAQRTVTPGAAEVALDPIGLPASGYLRHVFIEAVAAGGAAGTVAADGPWNLFSSVTMQEVNGSNIVGGSGFTGWDLFLVNLFGGFAFRQDPRDLPGFVAAAPNPAFNIRVPAEISQKDGLGALVNQNAAALFQLLLSIAPSASLFSVAPTTIPTFTLRGWLEAWTLPAAADSAGHPQSQTPPLVGTAQYWSKRRKATLVGGNTVELTRLGNLVRMLIWTARDATGARVDTVFPDPIQFTWDNNVLHAFSQRYLIQNFWEKVLSNGARPAGVFVLSFAHISDGKMGNEDPNLWLGTTAAARVEITGTSAVGGSVETMVGEVAPIEANPAAQFVTPNATGTQLQPGVGAPGRG